MYSIELYLEDGFLTVGAIVVVIVW